MTEKAKKPTKPKAPKVKTYAQGDIKVTAPATANRDQIAKALEEIIRKVLSGG